MESQFLSPVGVPPHLRSEGIYRVHTSVYRGFHGQNGKKFLNISSNLSKFSKNRGSLGESWSKWGSFGESERKKVGSFWWHMERNPKLSAPPGSMVDGSEIIIKKEQKEEVQTAASICMLNVSSCVVYNNSWYLCAYIFHK